MVSRVELIRKAYSDPATSSEDMAAICHGILDLMIEAYQLRHNPKLLEQKIGAQTLERKGL